MIQPYEAKPTNITFQRGPKGKPEPEWMVVGGEQYKDIRMARFRGNKAECVAVAAVLNEVNNLK